MLLLRKLTGIALLNGPAASRRDALSAHSASGVPLWLTSAATRSANAFAFRVGELGVPGLERSGGIKARHPGSQAVTGGLIVWACLIAGCGGGGTSDGSSGRAVAYQARAVQALVRVDSEPAGANCPDGGSRVSAGLDANGNGMLAAAEVISTQYVCKGARGPSGPGSATGATGPIGLAGPSGPAGATALVSLDPEGAGIHCTSGGTRVSVGTDANNDGRLDPSEVSSVAYVCNGLTGAPGPTGSNGADGLSSLVALLAEPAGAHCAYGGTRVNSGIDTNRNGVLDPAEVTSTSYICAGPPGPGITWVDVTANSQAAQANTGYLADSTSEVAITLPQSLAVGDIVRVSGKGSGGWRILQNPSQWIATSGLPGNVEPGNDWFASTGPSNELAVAVSSDGQHMVAGVYNGQLQTSNDGGHSWTARDAQRFWYAVSSSGDGSRLAAADRGGLLYISSDFGVTWAPKATAQNWSAVASSADGKTLAATVDGGFIYVSSDYGQTWAATANADRWKSVVISADGGHLYATGESIGVYSSVDGGWTWTLLPLSPRLSFNQIAATADGQQVVAAAYNGQIYISPDYGATWTAHETSRQWNGVASSSDGSRLIAGENPGLLYYSDDHGRTWQPKGPYQKWFHLDSSATGDVLVAGVQGGASSLFVSIGVSKTLTGTAGSLSGPQGATIELQYSGNGRFDVLTNNDPIGGFKVRSDAGPNSITLENTLAGDPNWKVFPSNPGSTLEAYADRVSAKAGDTVQVKASVNSAHSGTWQLYRIGWYGGAGARRVLEGGTGALVPQPACPPDPATGLIRCNWTSSFAVQIPADAVSGLWLIRIVRDDGYGTFVPLVIRDDRPAKLLFQSSVLTMQAYNSWGGESLYQDQSGRVAGGKALQVSFDRPYFSYNRFGGLGAGDMLLWEVPLAHYLERYGYDVSYTTNVDVVRGGSATVTTRGAFLSVAHDEYWAGEERDILEKARDAGVSLLFFGANPAYWKVRLSDSGADGSPRVVTAYKAFPDQDPQAGTSQATGRFRDDAIGRPEDLLVGVMYESYLQTSFSMVVADGASFLYAGTGLATGDAIPRLIGDEYDRRFSSDPSGAVSIVARSPLVDARGIPGFAETSVYRASSGALVFGAGGMDWALALDGELRDPRVERMTANLITAAVGLPTPNQLVTVEAPPGGRFQPTWATNVRTVAQGGGLSQPTSAVQLPDGSLVVAEPAKNRMFSVSTTGVVAPYAGDGARLNGPGYDNVPGLQARFNGPVGLAADAAGNVYVADSGSGVIRKISNDANHTTTTVAGLIGSYGSNDGTVASARFSHPWSLAWLAPGRLLVADSDNNTIRLVDLAAGTVTTLASGYLAGVPSAVTAAPDGRVFFVESRTGQLRVIGTDSARTVTALTKGGSGYRDGPGTVAQLLPQGGLAFSGGALYVSDPGNLLLRKIVPGVDSDSTTVTTFAGTGKRGTADGSGDRAAFGMPLGISIGAGGILYVADGFNGSIRAVQP